MLNNKTGSRKYSKRMDRLQLYESKKLRRETPLSPLLRIFAGQSVHNHRPMYFRDVAGLEDLKTYLRRTAQTRQIAHAQLFAGEEGEGLSLWLWPTHAISTVRRRPIRMLVVIVRRV